MKEVILLASIAVALTFLLLWLRECCLKNRKKVDCVYKLPPSNGHTREDGLSDERSPEIGIDDESHAHDKGLSENERRVEPARM